MIEPANDIWRVPPRAVLLLAIALTILAEAIYLVVWGIMLFPAGDLIGKIVWTTTCGIAMGAVIGATVIVFHPNRRARAALTAFLAMSIIGSACAGLCSRIDARFDYFGGAEYAALFILAGIIPAAFGGAVYAWLLTSSRAVPLQVYLGRRR